MPFHKLLITQPLEVKGELYTNTHTKIQDNIGKSSPPLVNNCPLHT